MKKYKIVRKDNHVFFTVNELKAGEVLVTECDNTDQVRDHIRELLIKDEDRVLEFGGVVKALDDNGNVGGYAVLFTGKEDPDLYGDYFTKSTDFFLEPNSRPISLYHHGLDPVLKATKLGPTGRITEVRVDEVGVWVKAQLRKRNKYEKAILGLIDEGVLGFSTGTAPHLVRKKEIKSGVSEVESWPIVEVSFTPTPVEPRTTVVSMKAYVDELDNFDDRSPELKAVWSTEYRNSLPDTSFAYVAPGGTKDVNGKTEPRRLRYFPFKDKEGIPDEAHVKAALGRIPQAKVPDAAKKTAMRKVRAAAKDLDIDVASSKSLSDRLNKYIEDSADDGMSRDEVIKSVAREALTDVETVTGILNNQGRASNALLKAFSRVVGIDYDLLKRLNPVREIRSVKGVFEDELALEQYNQWELWNALCSVVKKLVDAKVGNDIAGIDMDHEAKIVEALDEYNARLKEAVLAQVGDFLEQIADGIDTSFYLRALGDPTAEDFVSCKGVAIDDHLALVVSAVTSAEKRVRANHEARASQKAGAVLSKATHTKFSGYLEELHNHVVKGQKMLKDMQPRVSKKAVQAIEMDVLRREIKMRDIERGNENYG